MIKTRRAKKMKNEFEIKTDREYRISELRARENENSEMILYGTPLTFETPTLISGRNSRGERTKYIEIVDKKALDNTDMRDTALKHQHKDVLARVRNKSLQLVRTEKGLDMIARLANTQKSKDIYTEVAEGLLPEMSFAFPLKDDGTISEWSRSADGTPVRRITHIPKLIDVSTAYNGAYNNTAVYARSLDEVDTELRALDNEKKPLDSEAETLKQKIILKGKV